MRKVREASDGEETPAVDPRVEPDALCASGPGIEKIEAVSSSQDVRKIVVSPARIHWIVDDELHTWTLTGSKLLSVSSGMGYVDLTLSGDRVYTLDSSGTIDWRYPTQQYPTLVTTFATQAYALHVDDDNLYFTAGVSDGGWLDRYGRDYESSGGMSDFPTTIYTGLFTSSLAGTSTHLYAIVKSDAGLELYRAAKPGHGTDITNLAQWPGTATDALELDASGLLVLVRGKDAGSGKVISMGLDGANQKTLATGAIRRISAVDSQAYFATDHEIRSMARDGSSAPKTLLSTKCRITALAAGEHAIYFGAKGPKGQDLWRMKL